VDVGFGATGIVIDNVVFSSRSTEIQEDSSTLLGISPVDIILGDRVVDELWRKTIEVETATLLQGRVVDDQITRKNCV
jgi:hypothetical protein